jgi:hypothetical protein
VVLDLWAFNSHTTRTFVHYTLSPLIRLLYPKFGLSYTADEQTSRAIAQCHCQSAKLTLQSVRGPSNVIICVHTVVFIFSARNFFKQHITPHPLVLAAVIRCVPSTYPPTHVCNIFPMSGAVKLSPKLYFVSPKCQKRYMR